MKLPAIICAVVIVLVLTTALTAQRMLLDQRYLNEFPAVERVKAVVVGTDKLDTYARFNAALWVINGFMINDLRTAPNGGMYDMPPAADRVHDRYRQALTYYEIDRPEPPRRDPRYLPLRNKYIDDPAFADWVLQRFFSQGFRKDYYAWTRKPMPSQEAVNAITVKSSVATATAPPKAKAPKPIACPKISVSNPTEVDEGQPITFTASVTGGDPELTPTYNWRVSAGTISSGQGVSTITVDTTRPDATSVTATVWIGGLDPTCSSSSSATTGLIPAPYPARKFDEFGSVKVGERDARLDNFAIQLQNEPMARGYVITYGGRTSTPTTAKTAGEKVTNYLVNTRGIEYSRIVLVDGGYREKAFTELWIVPEQRSTPPTPSPTVDPSEVRHPKKTTKKAATKTK